VSEEQLEPRIPIERTGEDEAGRAHRGLGGASHDERHDEVLVVLARGQVAGGMHKEGSLEPLGLGQERPTRLIVEIASAVGGIDQRAREA
jgi:hypothetical protein